MSRALASLTTRPFPRRWSTTHPVIAVTGPSQRPVQGGALHMTGPTPVTGPGGRPFTGMDPSDPSTFVRPWNPVPGMIAYLNFDGAATQGKTPTGGTWKNTARERTLVGARPARRPR